MSSGTHGAGSAQRDLIGLLAVGIMLVTSPTGAALGSAGSPSVVAAAV